MRVCVILCSPHQFPPLPGYEYLRELQTNSRGHMSERERGGGEKERVMKLQFGTMGEELKVRGMRK